MREGVCCGRGSPENEILRLAARVVIARGTGVTVRLNRNRNTGTSYGGFASGRQIDTADINALLELDVEPLGDAAGDLDDDAITSAVGFQAVDLELAEG